ncbi:MAG TPA: VOC family protein, partial [Candidatus Kryptonia bacterium]|nr:VOC family protein [Candidatus Kryptonia bacterium]
SDFNWCDFYIGRFKLELIEAASPDSFVRRFIDKRGEGLHHLSLETHALAPLIQRMEREHIRIVDRFDAGDGDMTAFISPRSAHGVLVQFWQVPRVEAPDRPAAASLRLRSGESIRLRVDHVSIAVRDIDAALAFFRRYFPVNMRRAKHVGYDGNFSLCSFYLNGYKIELIEPLRSRESFLTRFFARRGEGFHHLSIDVDRLAPLLEQLAADGVRIVDRADLGGGRRTAFISPRSAHGVLIQFWQEPNGWRS